MAINYSTTREELFFIAREEAPSGLVDLDDDDDDDDDDGGGDDDDDDDKDNDGVGYDG